MSKIIEFYLLIFKKNFFVKKYNLFFFFCNFFLSPVGIYM